MQTTESTNKTAIDKVLLDLSNLLYVREYVYEDNWHSIKHAHNYSEMFYITQGKGSFLFDMQSCNVSAGDFIIINSRVNHTEISSKESPLGYIVIGVKGLETIYSSEDNKEFVLLTIEDSKHQIFPLLKNMLYESELSDENSEAVCNYLLKALLLKILRNMVFSSEVPHSSTNKLPIECATIKRYIDLHFKENITLDDLAEFAHLSKYYIVHMFKGEYGTSPISYLQYRRITEGKRLIEETQMPISQIVEILGFSSASQFSQCFKRLTSLTPSQFRKSKRENTKT